MQGIINAIDKHRELVAFIIYAILLFGVAVIRAPSRPKK